MSEAERWLIEDVDGMPDGVVRLTLSTSGLELSRADRVLWVPEPPERREAVTAPFEEAERSENQVGGSVSRVPYEVWTLENFLPDPVVRRP